MSALVTVAFACNDERGNETERVEAVNFVSEEHGNVDLCCQMPRGQAFRRSGPMTHLGPDYTAANVKVGRRYFTAKGWRPWYGNMAWNATGMTLPEAERLLRYLLDCGYTVQDYDCDTPFSKIIEAHERASHSKEGSRE